MGGMKPRQFSLGSLLVATALLALACALVRYAIATDYRIGRLLAALSAPMLVCGAVSVVRGQFRTWLGYAAFVEFVLCVTVLVWLLTSRS